MPPVLMRDQPPPKTAIDYVSKMVCPQQLGIGVSSVVELKNVITRIWSEERLASGRGRAVVKDDRINANNIFDIEGQVLTAREWEKVEEPKAALFARTSEIQARTHADVYEDIFTRTTKYTFGVRLICTRKTGGEQGNP
jgi:hypothetical protein